MDIANWLNALNELLKFCIVIWGILGYSFNKHFKIRNLLLFVGTSIVLFAFVPLGRLDGILIIAVLFLGVFVNGSIKEKIKVIFIAEIAISIIDLFLLSLFGVMFPKIYSIDANILNVLWDIFWIGLLCVLYKYRQIINEYFAHMPVPITILLCSIMLGMGSVAGSIQYALDITATIEMKRLMLLFQTISTILITIGCVILCYQIVTKKNIQIVMEKEREKYLLEKKMYEEKFKKSEEIQKFRHDMKKHMKIIHQLCNDVTQTDLQIERLKKYVEEFLEDYPEQVIVYTGNSISDYFISELIYKLSHNDKFEYNIVGKLPEKIKISDADFSILLGNALDNAAEELQKIEGKCYFEITFKNYKDNIMINIKNTKTETVLRRDKDTSDGHGYGIKNMREVVDRYGGTLEIIETEDSFCVDIFI